MFSNQRRTVRYRSCMGHTLAQSRPGNTIFSGQQIWHIKFFFLWFALFGYFKFPQVSIVIADIAYNHPVYCVCFSLSCKLKIGFIITNWLHIGLIKFQKLCFLWKQVLELFNSYSTPKQEHFNPKKAQNCRKKCKNLN
jgi:hypothetical protein